MLKIYSYSDRIRYYWADEAVAEALKALVRSLKDRGLPETVTSQAFMGLEFGKVPTCPNTLIEHHVQRCVGRYFDAAGRANLLA